MLVSWGAGRAGVAAGKGTRRPKTCVLSIELGQRGRSVLAGGPQAAQPANKEFTY